MGTLTLTHPRFRIKEINATLKLLYGEMRTEIGDIQITSNRYQILFTEKIWLDAYSLQEISDALDPLDKELYERQNR